MVKTNPDIASLWERAGYLGVMCRHTPFLIPLSHAKQLIQTLSTAGHVIVSCGLWDTEKDGLTPRYGLLGLTCGIPDEEYDTISASKAACRAITFLDSDISPAAAFVEVTLREGNLSEWFSPYF